MFYDRRDKWDRFWLEDALHVARKSKDPSTKVGAVIVSQDNVKLSEGYNGFPRGIADTEQRLNDRDMKLQLVVHGEMNAVLNAVRVGISLRNTTLYVVATDKSGAIWGGPPCTRCTVECIQAGIEEYVSYPLKSAPSRWHASCEFAGSLIREAGLLYREVSYES
jgi:dCMP deaminase